jgi:hypothetical protein
MTNALQPLSGHHQCHLLTMHHTWLNLYKITLSLTDDVQNEKDYLENKKRSILIKQILEKGDMSC